MDKLKNLLKDNRGQAAVEFALIIPIFLMLVFGAIDFSFAMHKKHLLTQLSKEIAREASVTPSSSAVQTKADASINNYFGTESVSITYSPPLSSRVNGEKISVEAAYTYNPFTPGLKLMDVTELKSKSQARVEAKPSP